MLPSARSITLIGAPQYDTPPNSDGEWHGRLCWPPMTRPPLDSMKMLKSREGFLRYADIVFDCPAVRERHFAQGGHHRTGRELHLGRTKRSAARAAAARPR